MCTCGCVDYNMVVKRLKINDDQYIDINLYDGCKDCGSMIGVDIAFYNKEAYELYGEGYEYNEVIFDEFGGGVKGQTGVNGINGVHIPIFEVSSIAKILKKNKYCPNNNIGEDKKPYYRKLSEFIEEHGLDLVQDAIRLIER